MRYKTINSVPERKAQKFSTLTPVYKLVGGELIELPEPKDQQEYVDSFRTVALDQQLSLIDEASGPDESWEIYQYIETYDKLNVLNDIVSDKEEYETNNGFETLSLEEYMTHLKSNLAQLGIAAKQTSIGKEVTHETETVEQVP